MRNHADRHELLVDVNDVKAAKGLKFNYEQFPTDDSKPQGRQFVEWCRAQIDKGNVVVAGFYVKESENEEYDHIMPVVGYKKNFQG